VKAGRSERPHISQVRALNEKVSHILLMTGAEGAVRQRRTLNGTGACVSFFAEPKDPEEYTCTLGGVKFWWGTMQPEERNAW
jgi:hypothetical protein